MVKESWFLGLWRREDGCDGGGEGRGEETRRDAFGDVGESTSWRGELFTALS